MSKSIMIIDTPNTCGDCPFCIYTAEEKKSIGYCNTSDEDFYCKILDRFMEYDRVDGGIDILGKPMDCPLIPENDVPTIQIEHKTGHWIYTDYYTWQCSECGGHPHKGTGFIPSKDKMREQWKYCNLCGAQMEV